MVPSYDLKASVGEELFLPAPVVRHPFKTALQKSANMGPVKTRFVFLNWFFYVLDDSGGF